jgi:acetyl-CoA acetyltransferase
LSRYSLRGVMAIVGAADTRVGLVPDLTSAQLQTEAARLALADAAISKDQIDGLISCNASVERGPLKTFHAEMVAELLGIRPRFCLTGAVGGALPVLMMEHAAAAIAAGRCNTVLLISADNILSGSKRRVAVPEPWDDPQFEEPYGPTTPAMYALIARAHMHAYGTTSDQFAAVAVACRKHASMNPGAQKRDPITIADVLNSRMIADPLHLLDCSLVSDGGAAIVMTAADRAKDFSKKPVYFLGAGEAHPYLSLLHADSLTESGAIESGRQAYAAAGVRPRDIDVAFVYDAFTPMAIIYLEDLGFCPKGEGGRFVEGGNVELGGSLPINTHGGLLSYCHAGLANSIFHITEAVRQLRGECGPRQVAGARLAIIHGQGGRASTHGTAILGTQETQ